MANGAPPRKGMNNAFRVVASIFILYLALDLFRNLGDVPGNEKLLIGVIAGLFVLAGGWFLISALRDIKREKEAEEAAAQQAAELEVLESPSSEDDEDNEDSETLAAVSEDEKQE